jgi:hypothetical protein
MISTDWWRTQPEWGTDVDAGVADRLRGLLTNWARAFAEQRLGNPNIEFRMGRRGILPDESHSFLAAFDGGYINVDKAGYVAPSFCRPKPGGGNYALFSANTYSDEPYVSLNTEYIIQIGAAAELVTRWGWLPNEVLLEVGEYDAACELGGRITLVMEAKARLEGTNGLSSLLASFIRFSEAGAPPEPNDNHSRKYVELLRLTAAGPVLLLLVASGARWVLKAVRIGQRIEFITLASASREKYIENEEIVCLNPTLLSQTSISKDGAMPQSDLHEPNIDEAFKYATETEYDRKQSVYPYRWRSKKDAEAFRDKITALAAQRGLVHTRPWVWSAATTDGTAKSSAGRETGIELRFSFNK